MKKCKICLQVKSLDLFSKQAGSRDGFRHQCKDCELQRNKEWRNSRKGLFDSSKIDPDGEKTCSVCKKNKKNRDFYFDRVASSGLQTSCKDCSRKNTSRWQKQGRYGLKPGDFEKLVAIQDNKCGICKTDTPGLGPNGRPARWRIDHDHKTKEVRGLLCVACNVGLGMFRDDPEILESAIKWVG